MTKSKKSATYRKEAKNAKAVMQMRNWLKAVGINVRDSKTEGCDLVVRGRDGRELEVKIAMSPDEQRPAVDHFFMLASELGSRRLADSFRIFNELTQAAGYGSPKPINRGVEPKKKLGYEDNFEMVAMRHSEFRKVPNPTAEDYKEFDKVINKAVSRFMFINAKICRRHLIMFEDLKTYAMIWTANYLGLYKVQNPTNNDNERKLYAHLCQRFGNFIEVLMKKERNCLVDSETASVGLYGVPTTPRKQKRFTSDMGDMSFEDMLDHDAVVEESEDAMLDAEPIGPDTLMYMLTPEEEAKAEAEEREVSEAKRRKDAQKALKAALGSLDHDTLLTILVDASENTFIAPDARSEAKKQLRLHRESCPKCRVLTEADVAEAFKGTEAADRIFAVTKAA